MVVRNLRNQTFFFVFVAMSNNPKSAGKFYGKHSDTCNPDVMISRASVSSVENGLSKRNMLFIFSIIPINQ